jgi:hypothetical protein
MDFWKKGNAYSDAYEERLFEQVRVVAGSL